MTEEQNGRRVNISQVSTTWKLSRDLRTRLLLERDLVTQPQMLKSKNPDLVHHFLSLLCENSAGQSRVQNEFAAVFFDFCESGVTFQPKHAVSGRTLT